MLHETDPVLEAGVADPAVQTPTPAPALAMDGVLRVLEASDADELIEAAIALGALSPEARNAP